MSLRLSTFRRKTLASAPLEAEVGGRTGVFALDSFSLRRTQEGNWFPRSIFSICCKQMEILFGFFLFVCFFFLNICVELLKSLLRKWSTESESACLCMQDWLPLLVVPQECVLFCLAPHLNSLDVCHFLNLLPISKMSFASTQSWMQTGASITALRSLSQLPSPMFSHPHQKCTLPDVLSF